MVDEDITGIEITDNIESIELGAGHGDACDIDATLAAFEREMRIELAKLYPKARVSYSWVPTSLRGLQVDIEGPEYDHDYEEERERIQLIAEDIYQRGTFWVPA